MTSEKLMIVGAGGRVGRLLTPAFRALGVADQLCLAHRASERLAADYDELRWDPLTGPAPFADWVAENSAPSAVLVLAGSTPSTRGEMDANVAVAQAVLTAVGDVRVLLASSSAVYGAGRTEPWGEDDTAEPSTPYGVAKLEMERACAAPNVTSLRIGNVAGADALLTNPARPLEIHRFAGGLGPRRSYIGPISLARVIWGLATAPDALPPILNLGTPAPVDMADLAEAAGLPWTWQDAPDTAIGNLTLDCTALERLVGFEPTESTARALVRQWQACQ